MTFPISELHWAIKLDDQHFALDGYDGIKLFRRKSEAIRFKQKLRELLGHKVLMAVVLVKTCEV